MSNMADSKTKPRIKQENLPTTDPDHPIHRGQIMLQWDFPEYIKHDRGPLWYALATLIAGGLFIWAAFDGNFLFALMIVLLGFIVLTHHRNEPLILHFTLYERGIQIGDKYYPHRDIDRFALVYDPPFVKVLYIMPKNAMLRQEIPIPLKDQDPVEIRTMLLDYIREDLEREDEENYYETINRLLKLW